MIVNEYGGIEVVLTNAEKKECIEIGRERNKAKGGRYTRRVDTVFNDEELYAMGVIGEMAVSKLLKVPFDRNIYVDGDGGTDIVVCGVSATVKFAHKRFALLMVEGRHGDTSEMLQDFHTKIAIATFGMCPMQRSECMCRSVFSSNSDYVVTVAGWTSRLYFMENHYKKDFGLGLRYCLNQKHLFSATSLLDRINKESKR